MTTLYSSSCFTARHCVLEDLPPWGVLSLLTLLPLTPIAWVGLFRSLMFVWEGPSTLLLSRGAEELVALVLFFAIGIDSIGSSGSRKEQSLRDTWSLSSLKVLIVDRSCEGSYWSGVTLFCFLDEDGMLLPPGWCTVRFSSKYWMSTSCRRPDSAFATPSYRRGILSLVETVCPELISSLEMGGFPHLISGEKSECEATFLRAEV